MQLIQACSITFQSLFRRGQIILVSNAANHPFQIGNISIGRGKLFLIAGPCVIESEQHARMMADSIQRITSDLGIPYIFKASYDKANRTSIHSFRGPGVVEGTRILRAIAEQHNLPVLTDVHTAEACARVAESVDLLQIPAFLCRQTDLLIAAGRAASQSNRAVNVKKGQFVAPADMHHAVQKIRESGCDRVSLTERGASFGYNNLVVDMRSLPILREFAPVVFDGTHSVQTPSAANGVSGGQPEFIPVLTRAAVAAGVDGVFLEVHDNPPQAKSDGANALHLNHLREILEQLLAIHQVVA
jgi:2-dehydro-3-deoxyphosphooctonate aldolase (KDO 8-P synthase)